jgi:hypothetical protein
LTIVPCLWVGKVHNAWHEKYFLIFKNYIQTIINILTIDFLHNIFKEKKMQYNGLKSPPLPLSPFQLKGGEFDHFFKFSFFHL